MSEPILQVKNLKTYFFTEEGVVPAVDGLDFELRRGETLAIVGESGCGKSVTSLSILGIVASPPGKILEGEILYLGENLLKKSQKEMRRIRGNDITMIFQEPLTSLNPVFTIGRQFADILRTHHELSRRAAREKAVEMLERVKIPSPEKVIDDYPHQLSGGMRQRVMIAMALASSPNILIADEPTTALDVTIQAQILHLLLELRRENSTAIILITHDLGIVAQVAENVMVMYAGQAVEYGNVFEIYKDPLHPYTNGLLRSVPVLGEERDTLYSIEGNIPSPKEYPPGCRFSPRCACRMDLCGSEPPPLVVLDGGRKVRCWKFAGGQNG